MARLPFKHARRIASLFNTMNVAQTMLRDKDKYTDERYQRTWHEEGADAKDALISEYGIMPVGYNFTRYIDLDNGN